MPVTLIPRRLVSVGDIEMLAVDCYDWLDDDEVLTGTPLITEVGTADLTVTNIAVNTSAIAINERTVAIGEAVQAKLLGWVEDVEYRLRITATTASRKKVFDVLVLAK